MRSGEMAAEAGVNLQTIRYYERRGLLSTPSRSDSGYRSWGSDAVRTVRFIKRAQSVGFTLKEIESLLELVAEAPDPCEPARRLAADKLAELDEKLAVLQMMRESVARLLACCADPESDQECPLIKALSSDDECCSCLAA